MQPPDVHVTQRFTCAHFKTELDVFGRNVTLLWVTQQRCLVSRNLKALEVRPPPPCLVSRYKQKYACNEGGWCSGPRGRKGGMGAGCDVTTWPWQGHRSRCTQADSHQTQSFSLHDWIILILVWQKVNICNPSWAVHARVEGIFIWSLHRKWVTV